MVMLNEISLNQCTVKTACLTSLCHACAYLAGDGQRSQGGRGRTAEVKWRIEQAIHCQVLEVGHAYDEGSIVPDQRIVRQQQPAHGFEEGDATCLVKKAMTIV